MRAFAACLTVVLGLGAFSVVACSSDATTSKPGGDAGEAGAPSGPSAGGGGATSTAGAPSGAGADAGAAGAAACSFDSDTCRTCLGTKCMTPASDCLADNACGKALTALEGCACDASKTFDDCATEFGQAGKVPAADLVTCYTDNCTTACQ